MPTGTRFLAVPERVPENSERSAHTKIGILGQVLFCYMRQCSDACLVPSALNSLLPASHELGGPGGNLAPIFLPSIIRVRA